MVRPRRIRRIFFQPDVTYFKPAGISMAHLKETVLSFDELEAIRLIDSEGMEQSKAGKKMKISQSTLSRILTSARKKISDAIINGNAIKIQGGDFAMVRPRGMGMRRMAGAGGRGRMGGPLAAGPAGYCVCPKCGHKVRHTTAVPCSQQKCPKCGTRMTRE